MKITGSEALLKSLLTEGVTTIFGYPGGAIMPVYNALYDYKDKLKHVLVRHEQAAAHAAEGYARITGSAGVCFATSGPGATNLVTGIADAMLDSVPLVCITGQVSSTVLGTDAFQEVDIIGITTPITKWNYQVTTAEEIPAAISKAFTIAQSGRPGPVLIDITKNAQFELIEYSYTKSNTVKTQVELDQEKIKKAAELLNTAKHPYVLVGHGVLISKAEQVLLDFIEKGQYPVASTLLGLSAVNTDHPLYAGMLGMHGNYAPNKLTNQADVILAVGMRFDDRVTGRLNNYAPNAKIIHIDIDPAEHNKNVPTALSITADAKDALQALLPYIKTNNHKDWLTNFKEYKKEEHKVVIDKDIHPELIDTKKEISMAEVIEMISEKTQGKAVIVADVGQHQMKAARYYRSSQTDSFITSGGAGTMGFALPAAMGAKFAAPNRQVIAVSGDGGFQMNIQELATLAQENLPVKIVILNNNFLGMVRQWQELFFENRYSFVNLKNPDFVQVAKGFYIDGQEVKKRSQLSKALDTMLALDKPYLLNIFVEKEENVFPMIPTGASVDEIRLR